LIGGIEQMPQPILALGIPHDIESARHRIVTTDLAIILGAGQFVPILRTTEDLSTRFGVEEGRGNFHLGGKNHLHPVADGVRFPSDARPHAAHDFIRRRIELGETIGYVRIEIEMIDAIVGIHVNLFTQE
jgi:hypothetical protein